MQLFDKNYIFKIKYLHSSRCICTYSVYGIVFLCMIIVTCQLLDTTLLDATLQYIPKSLTHRITINRQIKLQPRLKTHLYENTWLRNSTIPSVIRVEITDCRSKCLPFTNSIRQYKNANIRQTLTKKLYCIIYQI